jgi:hypothetical protein
MLQLSYVLLILSCLCAGIAAMWAYRSYKRFQTNVAVARELERIIESTNDTINKTKKTIAESRGAKGIIDEGTVPGVDGAPDIMESPELMSTIITVLINKYGSTRLGLDDFMIPDGDYVSVYVDTATQEIILSLDKNLTLESEFVGFTTPDDGTYH